jgi:hypothetical protein
MRIYVGYDSREADAYAVAEITARRFGCDVYPVYENRLRELGLLTRPVDRRGLMWDLNSNAAQSTEFAISRFWVPLLAHSGWCLAVDCDVVFMRDPEELRRYADATKAVCVVKHPPLPITSSTKMDGQQQVAYERKNWSSVALWNVDHPANRRLNPTALNSWPGRDLHAFKWLADEEIGTLPPEANWLVGVQPKPERPIIAHYTLGVPSMPGYENSEHAEIWTEARMKVSER